MSQGIKLVRLAVQHVGVITGRLEVGPFADGINVIGGGNEVGKSTLVEALRAALFERHDSKNQKVKALQTHGTRNAPEVFVELDIGGDRISMRKRFLEGCSAELRLHRDGTVVRDADADDHLLTLLDGRRPGKRGSTRNDMGLWGLLWVAQDDSAHADPGDALDENVRGALSDAIGRQVGQVLGGKHGERVRSQVIEHVADYFTPKTGVATGEYRAAEERVRLAEERVKKIAEAMAEVETWAAEHQALGEQLREAQLQIPQLERELDDAVAAEQRVQELQSLLREAESRVAAAKAVVHAIEQEVDARASLVLETRQLEAGIEKCHEAAGELAQASDHAKKSAASAREAARQSRTAASDARTGLDTATGELERARRREEAERILGDLRAAEEVGGAAAEAEQRLEAEKIDEPALEQIESLSAKTAALRARLDSEGTRIVVFSAEGEAAVHSVGCPARIDVPGLGELEVEPARPGLARAVADAEKRRTKLEEALLALEVADVSTARVRRAKRAEAEQEAEALGVQKTKLAPEGLDALDREVRARHAERVRCESALDEAARADRERGESLRALAGNRLDEAAMDGLRQREREVAVARAACDAIGTSVEVLALTDLRVRMGDGETAQVLPAGGRMALTSITGTTVTLEEIAAIKLEPRGHDLAASRARLERGERDLADTLMALGVRSATDAAEAARAWARADALRRQADDRLADVAPQGLAALRAEVERTSARGAAAEGALVEARRVFARHAEVEVEVSQNRITEEALSRLTAIERELGEAEAAIEKLQARVRAVGGAIASGGPRQWAVARPTRLEGPQRLVWEIVPGEVGQGLDVDGLERRLREALQRLGTTDLDSARARFRARLTTDAQVAELRKRLCGLAPDGLEALRARTAALELADSSRSSSDVGSVAVDVAPLRRAVEERRFELRALEASAERDAEAADRAEREARVLEISRGEIEAAHREKSARLQVVRDKLTVLRAREQDATLAERKQTARAELDRAVETARIALSDLEAATPRLLRDEVLRAKGAIESHRRSIAALYDKVQERKVLLDRASVEGHFELFEAAQVELLQAKDALERVTRHARAARLLSTVVEDAYAESQQVFLAPVLTEAKPYLSRLRPGTDLRMTRDLRLEKVVRRGAEEDFGQLSGGTREQLSVIVRLSLARVMARDNRPLPLILDDTMGWTDDGRFLSMVQILRDAASELQIILLTCHPARFARFQAEYAVDLDRLREVRAPAPVA